MDGVLLLVVFGVVAAGVVVEGLPVVALLYGWKREPSALPATLCGFGVFWWLSPSGNGRTVATCGLACEAVGCTAERGLIAANPELVGALTEANPDEPVVGGGRVS